MKTKLDSCPGAGKILDAFVENYVCPHCDRAIKIKNNPSGGQWMVSPHNRTPPKAQRAPFGRKRRPAD